MKTTVTTGRSFRLRAAVCLAVALWGAALVGQPAMPGMPAERMPDEEIVPRLKFNNATLDIVLEDYGEKTGRTLLMAPTVPKVAITLQSQGDLSMSEYLQAIETVLSMNGVALLEVGEKFIKVVPVAQARQESMPIGDPTPDLPATDRLVSQMIPLRHIDLAEAQKAVEALKHKFAQVHMFERINSILITDTAANVERITEILDYVDQPVPIREEPHVVQIRFTKASDIKAKLEEIIADAQKEQQAKKSTVPPPKRSGSPGVAAAKPTPRVAGVIRPPKAAPVEPATMAELIAMAERGIIHGKVKIIADERTNLLIIITRPENMRFFEKIIRVLDVETEPDVIVRILRLEYADAESVAETLNTLIGEVSKEKEGVPAAGKKGQPQGTALREYVEKLRAPEGTVAGKSKIGQLSAENIKILPDKRTNSLLIMASKSDFGAIEELVKFMDIMLSQVMIEVVIFKIGLTEAYERGIDWVQRALVAYEGEGGRRSPMMAFAGAGGGERDRERMANPLGSTGLSDLSAASGNLSYYFTFFNMNLDAIIRLVASDGRSEIVASPIVLTTDNKEATINVTKEKYFFKGLKFVSTSGSGAGEWVDDVTMRKIGTKLTVTPRINEKKFVVMEISQSFEEEGAGQRISGAGGPADWPTVDSSELTASVAVRTGETIVLGGLVSSSDSGDKDRIPVIGDIPLLGRLFQWVKDTDTRDEIVVFITPYVLDTPEDIEIETVRRRKAMAGDVGWPQGSGSSMHELDREKMAERERLRLQADQNRRMWWRRDRGTADDAAGTTHSVTTTDVRGTRVEPVRPPVVETEAVVVESVRTDVPAPEVPVQPDVGETAEPAGAAAEATTPPEKTKPDIDPELLKFIEKEDRKWRRQLQKIDELIEQDLNRE